MIRAAVLFMVAAVCAAFIAHAAPPSGEPGRFSEWFRSLMIPGTVEAGSPQSCCDESDCRMVDHLRVNPDTRLPEALLLPDAFPVEAPTWVAIPDDKIIRRDNPTGRAVLCWLPGRGVLCFVMPPMI